MAILAYSDNALRGEQLRETIIQCAQECKPDDINAYVNSISLRKRPTGTSYWLPPPHDDEEGTVALDTNIDIRADFQRLLRNVTFAIHLVMPRSQNSQLVLGSIRLALHSLIQRNVDTTVLAFLSMYRAICKMKSSSAVEWCPLVLQFCHPHQIPRTCLVI